MEDKPHYLGHRQRLRSKLLEHGRDSLANYELLELLLGIAIPRRDVKPLAKELIAKFKMFSKVIEADPVRLREVKGIGEAAIAAIKIVAASQVRALEDRVEARSVIANWSDLVDYCRLNIGSKDAEEFHVLYLDIKCRLIRDETHSSGTINSSSVYPREILKRTLELGAASVIVAHNHPAGDPNPSRADIVITEKLKKVLATIDVPLVDHIVVAKGAHSSFKTMGLL
jgi:DNA repair protein RadC